MKDTLPLVFRVYSKKNQSERIPNNPIRHYEQIYTFGATPVVSKCRQILKNSL
jgi:hypothetical protein